MGGVSVAIAQDPWAIRTNPSLAASLAELSVSAAYSPSWLGIRELSRSSFAGAVPTPIGTFACSGAWFGFSLYRETSVSLTYATAMDTRFWLGVAAEFYHLRIERYGTAWTLGFDLGISYALMPEVLLGAAVVNVNAPRIGACHEPLPQEFSAGVTYTPIHGMALSLELNRELGFPAGVCAGVSCSILECITVRAGATDEPETYSAGAGVSLGSVCFDYGMSSHPDLGISHHVSLTLFPGSL